MLDDVDPTSDWVAETHPPEFDVDYDWEVELDEAGKIQMDADPVLGVHDQIPVSDMAGPSGTASRSNRIPRVPRCTRPTDAAITDVLDDDEDEFESESEIDDDAEGEDAHSSSDDD